jgi:quercetin 2,3-dioxygenase
MTALVVLKGALRVNGAESIKSAEVGLFDRAGESFSLEAEKDTTALLLSDEPINEPIVGQGPFVMNTAQEVRHAMTDYWSGKRGNCPERSRRKRPASLTRRLVRDNSLVVCPYSNKL